MPSGCDGGCQTGRASSGHENIHGIRKTADHIDFLLGCAAVEFGSRFYHSSKTNSEQKPGPIAASRPIVPGSGRRFFMTSSSTTSTEAEERFPTFRRQSHEASSCPSCNPS